MDETKLICYGGVGSPTGANFMLEIGQEKILVDCGMTQGNSGADKLNNGPFSFNPSSIKTLFITHAHIDHTGLVPKLVKDGFKGTIYSTLETKRIAELLLMDSAKINGEKNEALYNFSHVEKALSLWKTLRYHESQDFGGFSVELFNAGHVLGSAMVKFNLPNGKTALFSGDIGNYPSPLLKAIEQVPDVDYLLMESVYGDRNHEDKETRVAKLQEIIEQVIKCSSTLLIPLFALDRVQAILYELNNFFESKTLPEIPVFLDSPLAIKITDIYEEAIEQYNAEVQNEIRSGDEIFNFRKLRETASVRDSKAIAQIPGPKIILAGSGMSTGGRILSHEAIYLPDANNVILFVGYQAPGTLGRQIEEGMKEVVIDEKKIKVRARIERIDGFSAHADSDGLVDFANKNGKKSKKVFIAMGEPKSSIFLAQRLRDELGIDAFVPEAGKTYILGL